MDQETPKPYGMTFPDGTSFDWPGRIERLRGLPGGLNQAEGLEEIEVGLRLNFVGEARSPAAALGRLPGCVAHARFGRSYQGILCGPAA